MYNQPPTRTRRAFTLVELLIVIAILAVLAVVAIVLVNPAQLLAQARDSNRVSDMSSLTIALADYQSVVGGSMGSPNVEYVSLADSSSTCGNLGLPALSSGWTYHCAPTATLKSNNGTGWIPLTFSTITPLPPISILPIDPTNTTSSRLYYIYVTNGTQYEITSVMESTKYKLGGTNDVVTTDGGRLAGVYEKGTQLGLEPLDYGDTSLIGYWTLNEGAGTTAYDLSSKNNGGFWLGTAAGTGGTYYTTGNTQSYAGIFNGTNDVVSSSIAGTPSIGDFTIAAWITCPSGLNNSTLAVAVRNLANNANASIKVLTSNVVQMSTWNGTTAYAVPSGSTVCGNGWHFVTFTRAGTALTGYVDGIKFGATADLGFSVSSQMVRIGDNVGGNYFNGSIQDVRIYTRAFSLAEIQALYKAQN